jgi:hypothetical protein
MTVLWLKRTLPGFAFLAPYDAELAAGYPIGSSVKAEIRGIRSGGQHRLYWALVRTVWKHQEKYPTPERLHLAIKFELGVIDRIELLNGEIQIIAGGTNYDAMDQARFYEHLERTIDLVITKILPGIPRISLTREVYGLLKLPPPAGQWTIPHQQPSRQR